MIRNEFEDGVLVFYVTGEIDHHRTVSLRKELDEQINRLCPAEVVLDLSGTDFCDSSGLGLILGRVRVCQGLSIELSVRNPSERVKKILDLCGAQKFLKFA